MKRRCSIRQYSATPVEDEKLNYLLKAAQVAPSAVNYQPWFFLVIREQEGLRKAKSCYPRDWFATAPLIIAVCGDSSRSWKRPADGKDHLDIDMGIVTEHICLAATEMGLGSCIVCNFDSERFGQLFNLPPDIAPKALIPIGYPADPTLLETTAKQRKPLHETVKWEQF